MTRECKKCGKPFTRHIAQVKRPGDGQYCSRSCARSGSPTRQKTSPLVECATCGKRFNKYDAEIKKNRGAKHFCSPECWYSFNQRDNHYLWTGGQHERMNPDGAVWRKAVFKRDRKRCRICQGTRRLEAHHILPFGQFPEQRWDVANGITLCRDCHTALRHRELEHAAMLRLLVETPVEVRRAEPVEKRHPTAPA